MQELFTSDGPSKKGRSRQNEVLPRALSPAPSFLLNILGTHLLALYCIVGAPSTKCLPETYFKSHINEPSSGVSLPQNVCFINLWYWILLLTASVYNIQLPQWNILNIKLALHAIARVVLDVFLFLCFFLMNGSVAHIVPLLVIGFFFCSRSGAMRRCHCRNFKQHKSNRRSRTFVIHLELFYVCRKLLLSRGKLYFLVCSFLTFCNPCGDFLRMSMQLLYMSGLERHWFNFLIDSVWVSQFAVVSEIIYINVEWGSALFSNWMAENGIYRKQLNDSDVL